MADKKESRFIAALTLHQRIRNRRLKRNIQSPNRFISTQNPRATRKRSGALKSADIILILNTTKVVRHQTRRHKPRNPRIIQGLGVHKIAIDPSDQRAMKPLYCYEPCCTIVVVGKGISIF